jgi:predicted nucleic acid-binding protein
MASRTLKRVFIDTNVLFSGLTHAAAPPASILDHSINGDIQAVISVAVLEELLRNLTRKSPRSLERLTAMLATGRFEIGPDPPAADIRAWVVAGLREDGHVAASLVAAACTALCTGDRRLRERL